jgi:hypothetical protein
MRIPIVIARVPCRMALAPMRGGRCRSCGSEAPLAVERRWLSLRPYYIPMGSGQLEHIYTCPTCHATYPGPPPTGAPPLPFMDRFGLLIFISVVLGGLMMLVIVPATISHYRAKRYRAEQETSERESKALERAAKQAKEHAESATKRCFDAINASLHAAYPKGLMNAAPLQPTDLAPLRGAGFVAVGEFTKMPIPRGPLFGPPACQLEVPKSVSAWASYGSTAYGHAETFDDAARLEKQALATVAPPVFGTTAYRCTQAKGCVGVVAWTSLADHKPLAVLRATKRMNHLGWAEDGEELAPMLGEQARKLEHP